MIFTRQMVDHLESALPRDGGPLLVAVSVLRELKAMALDSTPLAWTTDAFTRVPADEMRGLLVRIRAKLGWS